MPTAIETPPVFVPMKRPTGVTLVAVFAFLGAVVSFVLELFVLWIIADVAVAVENPWWRVLIWAFPALGSGEKEIVSGTLFLAIEILVTAALCATAGYGLWKLRERARILAIASLVLAILHALTMILTSQGALLWHVLTIAIEVSTIVYLLQPRVRSAFSAKVPAGPEGPTRNGGTMKSYFGAFKKYAVFAGRASRTEFWAFQLPNTLIAIILIFVDVELGTYSPDGGLGLLSSLFALAVLIPSLAVSVRRLHDTGRSGWYLLIGFVPLAGAIALFVFALEDGQPGKNRFGPNPKEVGRSSSLSAPSPCFSPQSPFPVAVAVPPPPPPPAGRRGMSEPKRTEAMEAQRSDKLQDATMEVPKRCPSCGTLSLGTKFCQECGSRVQQAETCLRCGARLMIGTKFCGECGAVTAFAAPI